MINNTLFLDLILIRPSALQQKNGMCRVCRESHGERLVSKALTLLGIPYLSQQRHPCLRRLKYDFLASYQSRNIYIEFDGIQHFEYVEYYHKSGTSFEVRRQRDLIKNYVIQHTPKTQLIRLDYQWVTNKNTEQQLAAYLLEVLNAPFQPLIGNSSMYSWLHDVPSAETWQKYVIADNIQDQDDDDDSDSEDLLNSSVNLDDVTSLMDGLNMNIDFKGNIVQLIVDDN
jgi:hypothetical protein